jgi:hypothetical protein
MDEFMGSRQSLITCLWSAIVVASAGLGASAEDNQAVATVSKPATVTARPVTAAERSEPNHAARVIVSVTGFQPPQDGSVEVVVKAQGDRIGTEQEIGRFSIFPQAEFKAVEPSKAQRFGLQLPQGLASGTLVKLNVYLVPLGGDGKGSRLELGGAEIY